MAAKSTILPTYNHISNYSTVTQWNTKIKQAIKQNQLQKSLNYFIEMKQNNIQPNNLTFPLIAKACGKLMNLCNSQIVHTHVVKSPYCLDKYVQTGLVDMYVKCGCVEGAYKVFDEMSERDVVSWNAMILGFCEMGFLGRGLGCFDEMRVSGVEADSITVIGLVQLGGLVKDVRFVSGVHCLGVRIGVEGDVSVGNTLIASYAKCGDLGSAEKVFSGIGFGCLSVVSWNSLIAGCGYGGELGKSVGLYRRMLCYGFRPDGCTILNLLTSCVQREALNCGKSIHSQGIKVGCDTDIAVLNTLISMYSKTGDVCSARDIFDSMKERTCVSWTAIIGCYAENGDLDEAMALFQSMEAAGQKPDLVTALYIISGCGQIGALETGRWIHSFVVSNKLHSNLVVSNALIDMYAKCGYMTLAREIFNSMPKKSIVSWTTIISGYALNGEFKEALDHFELILELGLTPNHVTFLSVLQACNHAGFLEKGWECFQLMANVYKLCPQIEHYSCIADLLGRKGKLREALEFVQNMCIRPDAGIWGTLLSACKIHHNVEIGQYAAERLLEIEPQVAAPYVEMANIYASIGRWDGVSKMRTMMKENQVTKYPGQSVVQVNGRTHTFTVEERCHPADLLICDAIDGLSLLLKEKLDSASIEEMIISDT
ncbi:Pentatricopeptide repeat-containing protein [Heracleum sosnowskyi]|uniref:Pentatricopeptide repeat-containing protein n=1 Tax=Heracleum sosnowskyi TaxID=360622 RepID=A0AAD8HQP0_9APIA|nr:Pentatricopeptide repeat-containing protein [Heracleum sosnowskyi]